MLVRIHRPNQWQSSHQRPWSPDLVAVAAISCLSQRPQRMAPIQADRASLALAY